MQAVDQFRDAMAGAGLPVPDTIHDDGKLHRFSSNGQRGDDSGWYVLHSDGVPAGVFGDWRQVQDRQAQERHHMARWWP